MKYFFSFWIVFCIVALNVWDASGFTAGKADPPASRVRKALAPCGLEVTITSEAVSCPQKTDGAIKIKHISGDFPMTVVINGGMPDTWTGGDYVKSGLPTGDYTVVVTDNNNCRVSEDIFIDEPDLDISAKVENICPMATYGAVITSISSSQPPYTQTWYRENTLMSPQPNNTKRLTVPGNYKIVLQLQDDKGCKDSVEVELKKLQPFSGDISHEDQLCLNGNSAIITVANPAGGSGGSNFEYEVKDSITGVVIPGFEKWTDNTITGLPAGSLTVTVRENDPASSKCILGEFTVTIDTLLQLNPPASSVTPSPLTRCDFEDGKGDGKILIAATHPAGEYSYWYSGMPAGQFDLFTNDDATDNDPLQTTVTDLPPGIYRIVVTEKSGCVSDTLEAEVKPTELSFDTQIITPPTCLGKSDGKVGVTINEGHPPFQLQLTVDGKPWYAEDPVFPTPVTTTSFEVEKVSGGTYTFIISDDAQCVDTVEMEIDAPEWVAFTLDSVAPACNDAPDVALGVIIYEITGVGNPLAAPTTETFAVYLNATEIFNPAAFTDSIKGLAGGVYEVTVKITSAGLTDGCLVPDTVTLVDPEPPVVLPDDDNHSPTCVGKKDGEYGFTVDAPVAVYQYYLSDSLPDPDALPPADKWKKGYDDVTGNDAPDEGDITVGSTKVHYTIERYQGKFTDLDTGVYYLWIRDTATHCIYTELIEMKKEQRLILTIDSTRRLIDGKRCEVEVDLTLMVFSTDEASSQPYEFKVDGNIVSNPDLITIADPDKKYRIPVKIGVTDAIGCRVDSTFIVVMPRPVKVDVADADTLPACNQDQNGYIKLQGDKSDYSYEWRRTDDDRYKDRILSSTDSIGMLEAGVYAVHVTDSEGLCWLDSVFTVKARHYLEVKIDAVDGKSEFCPDELIRLSGTITVDDSPFTTPNGADPPWWTLPAGDSLVFPTHNPVSFKADETIPAEDNRVILTAAYRYHPDTTCVSRDTFPVVILPSPMLSFPVDTVYIPIDETYPLEITSSPDFTGYRWSSIPDGHTDGLPSHPDPLTTVMLQRPERPYFLILELENTNTCRTRDSVYIGTSFEFFIPNAFTPNGDGIHDLWKFYPLEQYVLFYTVEATVFSRAGIVVYSRKDYSNDPSVAFDGRNGGKNLPVGTYYYVVKLIHRQTGSENVYTGSVTIIR
ncbi:MAG: gliding motility-associated C-terminal domain-containing protein [Bacteroidales bacterium]|jgi:gliding motility-associated-like protein|nr:gliding motility-associated C-terminal domain-containing protein [Bacteroidales bacterium]